VGLVASGNISSLERIYRSTNLIGAEGEAQDGIRKGHEGLIRIKGKLWRATSNQEIPYGQNVHVVGNDGLNLRLEVGPIIKSKEELLDKEIPEGIERRLQREDSSKF